MAQFISSAFVIGLESVQLYFMAINPLSGIDTAGIARATFPHGGS